MHLQNSNIMTFIFFTFFNRSRKKHNIQLNTQLTSMSVNLIIFEINENPLLPHHSSMRCGKQIFHRNIFIELYCFFEFPNQCQYLSV